MPRKFDWISDTIMPFCVGDGEVGGVAVARRLACPYRRQNAVRAYQLGALRGVCLGIEPLGRHRGEMRVRVIAGTVLVRQPLGLRLHVDRGGRLKAHAAKIEILENVQHLQGGETLRVGGDRVNVHPAVGGHERIAPFGMLAAQILVRQPPADALEVGIDGSSDGTLIEAVAASSGNESISAREIRILEHLALAGRLARRRVGAQGIRGLLHGAVRRLKEREVALEIEGDHLRQRGAALAQMDRGFETTPPN